MNIQPYRFLLAASLLVSFVYLQLFPPSAYASSENKGEIVIGLIPEMDVFKQMKRFQPLADFLSVKLNKKVKLSMLSRYGNIVDRLKEEKIDAAFLGSFTGALAISQLGLEPIVRPVNMDGTSTYHGQIFTRKDSGINTVADMKGKTFAFVERATTAGYVFPLAYLKKNNVTDIDSFFSSYYFTGSHDAAIKAVLSGKADVGAAKNTIYERLQKDDPEIDKNLIVLENSAPVPSNGLFATKDMIQAQKDRINDLLLSLHESKDGKTILKAMGAQRFVKTTTDDYQPVFSLAAEANLDIENYRYLNK